VREHSGAVDVVDTVDGVLTVDERDVELTKNHNDTKANGKACKHKEGKAVVLIAEDTIRVEGSTLVHVDPTLVTAVTVAVITVRVANTVVVNINGQVVKTNLLRTMSGHLGLETGIRKRKVLTIALLNEARGLSGPNKTNELVGTSPDIMVAETLNITETNIVDISSVPLNERFSE